MADEAASKWIIVAYDLPNEPSRLRLKAWRNFKKMGAVYPSVSLCILPNTPQARKKVAQAKMDIGKEGSALVLAAHPLEDADGKRLLQMFQEDRHKQYDEIYEECQEFLDEIKENLGNKKVTPEETDELEHAFEGLEKWYRSIREKGFEHKQDVANVDRIMEECRRALASFSEKAQPREINN
jgi:DNA repair exonuclease SbcCD ATPase subunit